MSDSITSACPFGPEYQLYWEMRYNLFAKFDETQVDAVGLSTMIPELFAMDIAKRVSGSTSLDICSGVGALSIALARSGQRVTGIEIDDERVAMARHNAEVYGVAGRTDFRAADITDPATIDALPAAFDTVFLDPPWGKGPGDYIKRPRIYLLDLQLGGTGLRRLLKSIDCRDVMMRLPPNFDIGIFRHVQGEKIAYVTQAGYLHWYLIRVPKNDFINLPDSSPPQLGIEQAREGFTPHYVSG